MQLDQNEPKLLGNTNDHLFIHGEDPSDFLALFSSLVTEYQPTTVRQQTLVEDAAIAQWIVWRRNRTIQRHESAIYSNNSDIFEWTLESFHLLRHMQQFRAIAERTCARAFARLDAMRRQQIADKRWQLNFELQQ
jgi:hypothetical protein